MVLSTNRQECFFSNRNAAILLVGTAFLVLTTNVSDAFSVTPWSATGLGANRIQFMGVPSSLWSSNGDASEEDDDGGWGTPDLQADNGAMMDLKRQELQRLQTDNMAPSQQQQDREQERDMFIPIFAIVSILGLVGSYTYELVRLASRGELYLPWQ